jgi:hypothetical protein
MFPQKCFLFGAVTGRIYINYVRGGLYSSDDGEQLFLLQIYSQVLNWPELANGVIDQNVGN